MDETMLNTPLSPPVTATLLDLYLAGEADSAQRAAVVEWLQQEPFWRQLLDAARDPDGNVPVPLFDLERLATRIDAQTQTRQPARRATEPARRSTRWAGVIGVMAAAAVAWIMIGSDRSQYSKGEPQI